MRCVFLLTVLLAASGCAYTPGQHLQLGDGWQSGQSDSEQPVVVRDISPKTILQLEQEKKLTDQLPSELMAYSPSEYRIGPGDALLITVWDHPELTTPAGQFASDVNARTVRADGSLYYPYLGVVRAAGMTLEELRLSMSLRLSKFITSPQLDISISRFGSRRIFLSGAFIRNESQILTELPLSLAEALGKAGINLDQADISGLKLRRGGKNYLINLDALARQGIDPEKIYLKNGDSLQLPYNDRKKVYVMGEVGSSKAITFKTETITLSDALGAVSGLRQESAKATSVYVIRSSEQAPASGADVFRMNANSPVSWVMASRFNLIPGDVVFVDTAGVVRLNRLMSGLFPVSYLIQTARTLAQ